MKAIIEAQLTRTLTHLVENDSLPAAVLETDIRIDGTKDKSHGDYASNIAMLLAKSARMKPRDIAEMIVAQLPESWEAEKVEIAGPGFINFWASEASLAERATALVADPRLGVVPAEKPLTVVVDYSAPNVAKQMHVGHLRSTIIGDAIVRTLEFLGHTVIRQNHVGDWGTQFGMLLAFFEEQADAEDPGLVLQDLEGFYQAAKKRFDEDDVFAERSRQLVVKLQSGDEECLTLWTRFNDISLNHCQTLYDRLGVKLNRDDVYGESKYNDDLANVVESLDASGLLTTSEGARVVFQPEYKNKNGEPLPLIVEKAGGGYLYATTDLAAVRHRVKSLKADRVMYVVDQRQALHFEQVFSVARKAGFLPDTINFEHLGFGTMNGEDGRPFRTRAGGTIKLADLLDEAVERALVVVKSKNPDMDDATLQTIAESVAISSVKYADLSKHRTTDYIFSFDQMLSLVGNTAPYLLYAYARIASIFRSANINPDDAAYAISLEDPREQELVVKLMQFEEIVATVAERGQPHLLCTWLYQVASEYSSFYEHCPVLNADNDETRNSRLALSALTQRTLGLGLSLLGITPLERM